VLADGTVSEWSKEVSRLAAVQAVVNVDVSAELAAAVADDLGLPLVRLADIDRNELTNSTAHPAHLPSIFGGDYSDTLAAAGAQQPLWAAVAAGDLTEAAADDMSGSIVPVVQTLPDDLLTRMQCTGRTLIWQTMSEFGVRDAAVGMLERPPAVIVVTDGQSVEDCLHFWNLRALVCWGSQDMPMCILPGSEIEHWLGLGANLTRMLSRPAGSTPDVLLVSGSLDKEQLDSAAAVLGLQHFDGEITIGYRFPIEMRTAPYTYKVTGDIRELVAFDRQYGQAIDADIHLFRGRASSLAFRSPVTFVSEMARGLMRLSGGPLSRLPHRPAVAALIRHEARWANGGVEFGVAGQQEYRFTITVPGLDEATYASLSEVVREHSLSDKGRLGSALRKDIDLKLLLKPGVYESIIALTTPRSKELLRELKRTAATGESEQRLLEIASTWGGRSERRYRSAPQVSADIRGIAHPALELLCSIGWAERGFEVHYQMCGVHNFVPLTSVTGMPSCPGCGTEGTYTESAKAAASQTVTIFYRLNAMTDRAADQGVIPHLLVEAALTDHPDRTYLVPGLDLVLQDGRKCEIDVFGVVRSKIVAGEVKTSATEFTTEQIARDISLSKTLGADIHILACIQELPETTIALAAKLSEAAGVDLRVLAKAELRPVI
jgi:hypothetical protein